MLSTRTKKNLKSLGALVVLVIGNYMSFLSGRWYADRNNATVALISFSYQVGFRDGIEKELAMDNHTPTRVLPGSDEESD